MKLINNKKGMELQTALVVLVIFGVVLILLIFLYKTLLVGASKEMDISKCQSSLLLTKSVSEKVKSVSCSAPAINPFTIDCPRTFFSVKEDKVLRNGKDVTSKYNNKCPTGANTCLQQNVVASEMEVCWNIFFNGEQPVLQQMEINEWKFFKQKDHITTCVICSEITVDKDTGDFLNYLKTKPSKSGVSYYDKLAKNPRAWCDDKIAQKATTCWDGMRQAIDTSVWGWAVWDRPVLDYTLKPGKYAVVFVRRGLSACEAESNDKKGDEYLTNTVQLIPADKVSAYCNSVMS